MNEHASGPKLTAMAFTGVSTPSVAHGLNGRAAMVVGRTWGTTNTDGRKALRPPERQFRRRGDPQGGASVRIGAGRTPIGGGTRWHERLDVPGKTCIATGREIQRVSGPGIGRRPGRRSLANFVHRRGYRSDAYRIAEMEDGKPDPGPDRRIPSCPLPDFRAAPGKWIETNNFERSNTWSRISSAKIRDIWGIAPPTAEDAATAEAPASTSPSSAPLRRQRLWYLPWLKRIIRNHPEMEPGELVIYAEQTGQRLIEQGKPDPKAAKTRDADGEDRAHPRASYCDLARVTAS